MNPILDFTTGPGFFSRKNGEKTGLQRLVIVGLVLLIRALLEKKTPVERKVIDILDERYAKGETTREEYLEKRKDILSI